MNINDDDNNTLLYAGL